MTNNDETFTTKAHLALIGVPSSAGARRTGQEGAPAALRAAGLLERLRATGLDVADLGDLPSFSYSPDLEEPREQNLAAVMEVAGQAADRVDRALVSRRMPIVLGGDCSLSLGVVSGLLHHQERLGLLYFDGDLDLNTPATTISGILDGMVIAHVLGRGSKLLAGIGPRQPMLSEEDIVLFGYDVESGWIDSPELEALERLNASKYPLTRVRADPTATAREALTYLESRSDAILIHFDIDVMDIPAADLHHPNGLDVESTFAALRVFVTAPTCAGVVVTEFNAEKDPDGAHAECLVEGLVEALGARL